MKFLFYWICWCVCSWLIWCWNYRKNRVFCIFMLFSILEWWSILVIRCWWCIRVRLLSEVVLWMCWYCCCMNLLNGWLLVILVRYWWWMCGVKIVNFLNFFFRLFILFWQKIKFCQNEVIDKIKLNVCDLRCNFIL